MYTKRVGDRLVIHPYYSALRRGVWAQRLRVYGDRLVLAIGGDLGQSGDDGLRQLRGLRTRGVQRLDGLWCDGLILLDGGGGASGETITLTFDDPVFPGYTTRAREWLVVELGSR